MSNLCDSAIQYVRSDKDTHFTTELIQNAGELENLNFPDLLKNMGIRECIIDTIAIIFGQTALEFDVYLWSTGDAGNSDADLDKFVNVVNFASSTGKQIAGTGNFRYAATGLNIPYKDMGPIANTQIHATVVNRSSTTRTAGVNFVIVFGIRPVLK